MLGGAGDDGCEDWREDCDDGCEDGREDCDSCEGWRITVDTGGGGGWPGRGLLGGGRGLLGGGGGLPSGLAELPALPRSGTSARTTPTEEQEPGSGGGRAGLDSSAAVDATHDDDSVSTSCSVGGEKARSPVSSLTQNGSPLRKSQPPFQPMVDHDRAELSDQLSCAFGSTPVNEWGHNSGNAHISPLVLFVPTL